MKTTKTTLSRVLLVSVIGLAFQVQAATLVNQWSFEGNANDTSGNSNNGTITGSPAYVPGMFGQAIYLPTGSYVHNGLAANLPTNAYDSWSMNFWVYLTNNPAQLTYMAGFGVGGASVPQTTRALISYPNQKICLWDSTLVAPAPNTWPLNAWAMLTVTHDGPSTRSTIYLNGSAILSTNEPLLNCLSQCQVGERVSTWPWFQGMIDEFTLWSGVLPTNDIASLYASNSLPSAPYIANAPQPVTAYAGEYALMSVLPGGAGPNWYQWQAGGTNIVGATNATLVLGPLSTNTSGTSYSVIVSNSSGNSVTSSPPATVTVLPASRISTALAAYWPFDELSGMTVADVTGNGNDGSMFNFIGDGSERVPGKLGRGLHFRGPSFKDYVQVGNNNIVPGRAMTVTAWVWVDGYTSYGSIIKNWPSGANYQFMLGQNAGNGDNSAYIGQPGGGDSVTTREGASNPLPQAQWVHVAMVCDGQTLRLYRNGEAIGSPVAYTGQLNTSALANTLGIGCLINATGLASQWWQGSLDDLGVWNRGLTPAEILGIVQAGSAGQPLTNADMFVGHTLPFISSQPQGTTRYAGEYQALLSVQAVGQGALSYQWKADGASVPGATNSSLSVPGPFTHSASYAVVITDAGNGHSVTSTPALLNILPVAGISTALAGHWGFDETSGTTAADSTSNGRTGVLNYYPGDNTTWVPGQVGGALTFDGSAQYVKIPNLVLTTNRTMTVCAWVWASAENNLASIVDCYGQTPIGQFRFGLGNSPASPLTGGVISQGPGYVAATEAVGFPVGSWQHVALVADGASIRLYRDGALTATTPYNGTIASQPAISNVFVGARIFDDGENVNSTPGYWTGMMDDLGMWARGLTADEIRSIYAAGYVHQPLSTADSGAPVLAPPVSQTVTEADNAIFAVSAAGATPFAYQWRKAGVAIPGATNYTYTLISVVRSDAADYDVVVSNPVGSVTSAPPATLTVTPLSLPPIATDLVGHWKLDETSGTSALDSAGTNNGVLMGFPPGDSQWVPGEVDGALDFGGPATVTTNWVLVPQYPEPTSTMTATAWVWADARPQWGSILKNWGTSVAGQFHFGLYLNNGDLSTYITQANGTSVLAREGASTPLPTNCWQHVACVCDGSQVRLFRNAVQVASVPYDGTLINPSPIAALAIGVKTDNTGLAPNISPCPWQGKLDDIGLWTRALTTMEIQNIYSAGLGGHGLATASFSPWLQIVLSGPNLVFSWPEVPLGRGFVLESKTDLAPGSWTPVAGTLVVSNGQCQVTVPVPSAASQFFRLHQ